jgi:phosphonate transport system ATP-binding protein
LLGLVNGMHWPSRGTVHVDGQPVTRRTLRRVQRRVGMVHQQFNLVPRLSVLDNVLCGCLPAISTVRAVLRWWPAGYQRRACRLLEQMHLAEHELYRRAAQLSGGQQQRVAIARAFLLEPAVVLADEPVASLDPTTSRSVLELLRQASLDAGATVLCSLHQVELATSFADRVVALRAGRIVFDGPPGALSAAIQADIYGVTTAPEGDPHPPRPAAASRPDAVAAGADDAPAAHPLATAGDDRGGAAPPGADAADRDGAAAPAADRRPSGAAEDRE